MKSLLIKLLGTIILVVIILWYVSYSQSRITELENIKDTLTQSLKETNAESDKLLSVMKSYDKAATGKADQLVQYIDKLAYYDNLFKEISDEDTKIYLTTPTPEYVRSMLESTDYYKGNGSLKSTTKLPK